MMRWLKNELSSSVTRPKSAQPDLSPGKKILFVVHAPIDSPTAGGTEITVRNLIKGMSREYTPYVLSPARRSMFWELWSDLLFPLPRSMILEMRSPTRRIIHEFRSMPLHTYAFNNEIIEEKFSQILDAFRFDIVHFQHLLRFPLSLVEIAKNKGAKVVISCHDAYLLCIQHRLLENGSDYCDACVDLARCDACLQNQFHIHPGFQRKWREYCRTVLNLCDCIIMDSSVTFDIYKKVLGIDRDRVRIIEPAIESPKLPRSETPSPNPHGIIKIGFVGNVSDRVKGRDIIIDLVKSGKQDSIEWHFFGTGSKIRKISRCRNVVNHEESGSIPRALIDSGIAIVILPYIGFESYSLALSNAWTAGLPAIVPNIAALGRRVREQQGGWTYPLGTTTNDLLSLIERIHKDPEEYHRVATSVGEISIRSIPEYCNDYERFYSELTKASSIVDKNKPTNQDLRAQAPTDPI